MMYGLYKSLIEIGCDNQEAAAIMYRESVHYSNEPERRTETRDTRGSHIDRSCHAVEQDCGRTPTRNMQVSPFVQS